MIGFAALATGVSVLGWCLLHFIWQAVVVGALYALARALLPRGNPRYLAAMLALAALAVLPVLTAWHELRLLAEPVDLAGVIVTGSATAAPASVAAPRNWTSLLDAVLPWLVLTWALGVGVLGVRVFRQWRTLRALLHSAADLPEWQARARVFAERMGLRRPVPVLASLRIATPALIGWVRPAVVLPLAVLARMPPEQVDLILAHELAHLRRLDHLANLFQVVLETLFFYHPVVHWISRDTRNERELCCDALALHATRGARRDFVAALAGLEELRVRHADLALAASGGVLAERAWFIADATARAHPRRHLRGHAIAVLAIAAVLALGGSLWREAAWQGRVAALVAADNASVLQWIRQDTLEMPALAPVVQESPRPRLLSLPHAFVSGQPAAAPVSVAPVQVAAVGEPTLVLDPADVHPKTSVAVPELSIRATKATAAPLAATPAAPRPLRTVQPVYPPQALLAGMQGKVVVEFALDATGVPHDLEVVGSSPGPFAAAALQALANWRFAPPARPGRRYRQAFTFRLGAGAGGDAAARACLVTIGTHICRHVIGVDADVHVLRPHP